MLENILLIIAGFFLLIKGADILVEGASFVAKKFHISEIVVGLTIVSIGTSMPELMVSLTSALNNHGDVAIGNVIGSNLANLLLILGISTVISSLEFKKQTKFIEIPMMLLITFTIFLLGNNGGLDKVITRTEGMILIFQFVCFLLYTIIIAKYGNEFNKENNNSLINRNEGVFKNIIFIVGGIVALKYGGDFVVNSACEIAESIGISEKIISLTIISIGTSLPELITSVTAAIKGDSDIAIGNVLGSNIFNFLLIIGISAIISPVKYSIEYNIDIMILFAVTAFLLVFPYIGEKNKMTRANGFIYVLFYVGYMFYLFIR